MGDRPDAQPNPYQDVVSNKWHLESSPERHTEETGGGGEDSRYQVDYSQENQPNVANVTRVNVEREPVSVIHPPDNSRNEVRRNSSGKTIYVDSKGYKRTGMNARWSKFKDKFFSRKSKQSKEGTGASQS